MSSAPVPTTNTNTAKPVASVAVLPPPADGLLIPAKPAQSARGSGSGSVRSRHAKTGDTSAPTMRKRSESKALGRAARDRVPRKDHAQWQAPASRPDPIAILEESNRDRLQELVPIRYGRMLASPFTFLRGSAAVMAADLATTPLTQLQVQACGDCHVLNFGLFATPERNLVFDLNDFDETHPATWEFDIKRLAASCVVAAREQGHSDAQARDIVENLARAYREHLRECADLAPLDIWYQRIDWSDIIATAPDAKAREFRERLAREARGRIIEHLFPKITTEAGGSHRLVDQPPLLYHVHAPDEEERLAYAIAEYRATLPDDRKVLFDRYRLEDIAIKVVGIGSVGTRCLIGLFLSPEGHPLLLQIKEAVRSVLEPYTQPSRYRTQGERVVMGQRLMQSSSDIFLGWVRGKYGKDFYLRQLRDMKMSIPLEGLRPIELARYSAGCGWTLARAHAKSGDAAAISAYLGNADKFDKALASFAVAYADQTERDHAALVKAVRSGRVRALQEEA